MTAATADRTDVHAPSQFDPADYVVIDYIDVKRPEYFAGCPLEVYEEIVASWQAQIFRHFPDWRTGGTDHQSVHQCNHCGHPGLRWVAVVEHTPTGAKLAFGETCADRCDLSGRDAFRLKFIKDAAALEAARQEKAAALAEWVALSPDNAAVVAYFDQIDSDEAAYRTAMEEWNDRYEDQARAQATGEATGSPVPPAPKPARPYDEFVNDVKGKFRRYGSLSEKQVACILRSKEREETFEQRKAEEAAVLATVAPLEEGRREIEGEVLSTKWQDSDFGGSLKMLVKQDDGNKLWGSVPGNLADLTISHTELDESTGGYDVIEGIELKGARVKFTAAVERSRDDEHFGFFKRPTKAEVLS